MSPWSFYSYYERSLGGVDSYASQCKAQRCSCEVTSVQPAGVQFWGQYWSIITKKQCSPTDAVSLSLCDTIIWCVWPCCPLSWTLIVCKMWTGDSHDCPNTSAAMFMPCTFLLPQLNGSFCVLSHSPGSGKAKRATGSNFDQWSWWPKQNTKPILFLRCVADC